MNGRVEPKETRFTYISTSGHVLRRSASFCELSHEGEESTTYVKTEKLGQGSFGLVSLMRHKTDDQQALVVKEAKMPIEFDSSRFSETQLFDYYACWKKNLQIEADFCKQINGFGCFYSTEEPIQVSYRDQVGVLTSHPHYYVATNYIAGVALNTFQIKSEAEFVRICLGAARAAHEIHQKNIVHGDIHAGNVIVGDKHVKLIDFSFSRHIGSTFNLVELDVNLKIKPPEFQGKSEVIVACDQDVYALGLLFSTLVGSYRDLISLIKLDIEIIAKKMMAFVPVTRASLTDVIKRLETIELEVLKRELIGKLKQHAMRLVEDFPLSDVIDQWCYCCNIICDLNMKGLDVARIQKAESDYLMLNKNEQWQPKFGAALLLKNRINLIKLLELLPAEKKIYLLRYLGTVNFLYLVKIPSIEHLVLSLPEEDRKELLLFIFEAKKIQLETSFDGGKTKIEKWCYCSVLIEKICQDLVRSEQLFADWRKLNLDKWSLQEDPNFKSIFIGDIEKLKRRLSKLVDKNIIYVLRYLGGECLEKTLKSCNDVVQLYQLVPVVNRLEFLRLFGGEYLLDLYDVSVLSEVDFISFVNDVAKMLGVVNISVWLEGISCNLLKKYKNDFENVAALIDKFCQPENNALYKQFLLALNNVYYVKRFADKRDYFTIFSCFKKQTKLNASGKLAQQAAGAAVSFADDENKAAEEGDLGAIGRRLRKLL